MTELTMPCSEGCTLICPQDQLQRCDSDQNMKTTQDSAKGLQTQTHTKGSGHGDSQQTRISVKCACDSSETEKAPNMAECGKEDIAQNYRSDKTESVQNLAQNNSCETQRTLGESESDNACVQDKNCVLAGPVHYQHLFKVQEIQHSLSHISEAEENEEDNDDNDNGVDDDDDDDDDDDVGLTMKPMPAEEDQSPAEQSQKAKETGTVSARIDKALNTLRSELMALREQDLQLLKQLINIDDNIRRLKRTRCFHSAGRTSSCGLLGARVGTQTPQGKVSGGKEGTSVLLRQRSEPGMTLLPRRLSVLTSASSIDTIADMEEVDSLYGSATDLDDLESPPAAKTTTPCMRRSSSAFAALTFTPEELRSGGDSSYGEILKRNVRLWKWSVARERDSGLEGQLLPCVL